MFLMKKDKTHAHIYGHVLEKTDAYNRREIRGEILCWILWGERCSAAIKEHCGGCGSEKNRQLRRRSETGTNAQVRIALTA